MNFTKLIIIVVFFFINTSNLFAQHVCTEMWCQHEIPAGAEGLAGDKTVFWEVGQTIRIKFIGGTEFLRSKVKQFGNTWMKYANIKFSFVGDNETADVRIAFNSGGSWSYLGTTAKLIGADQPTMNFGWFNESTPDNEFSRTVIHEFGHMLGMIHEHMQPDAGIPWDKPAVYAYYAKYQGWSKEQVDNNLFKKYDHDRLQKSTYDPLSIMHYAVSNELTIGDFEVGWNRELSNMDRAFIGQIYPFSNTSIIYPSSIASGWYGLPFSKVDAAVNYPGDRCYIFSGSQYVRWNHTGENNLTAKPIKDNWKGVTFSKIDAAFYWEANNKVYFFSGTEYIRYDVATEKADEGYPKNISANWGKGNMFSSVDAAVEWDTDKIYFFKDNKYIRFDFNKNEVDVNYPKTLSNTTWKGVSFTKIDAIVPWPGSILYLFNGSQYHRYDITKDAAY